MYKTRTSPTNTYLRELLILVAWYVATLTGFVMLILVLLIVSDQIPSDRVWYFFGFALKSLAGQWETYVAALIPYCAFLLIRSLFRDYRRNRWLGLLRGVMLKTALPISLVWGGLKTGDWYRQSEVFEYTWDHAAENKGGQIADRYMKDGRQRGMHVFNLSADSSDLEILKTNNVEWITLVPYINQRVYDKPPPSWVWDSLTIENERFERIRQYKHLMKPNSFYVMLKPHIWLSTTPGGTWRSDIQMKSEEEWEDWFAFYEAYMLRYASIAEEVGIDMLCIGTELHSTVVAQPDRWLTFIRNIRKVYSGKLTYAANWSDDMHQVPFWKEIDYIGIQAYYPLTDTRDPSLEELEAGWKAQVAPLAELYQRYNKPILFTELGYKSTTDAGIAPWTWESSADRFYKLISHKTQALCYQAFFNVMWSQPWFAGVHIWQWPAAGNSNGQNNRFTVEGKPALNVIAKGFSQ